MKTKSTKKKLLVFLAVTAMSLAAAGACNKNDNPPDNPNGNQEQPADDKLVLSGFEVPETLNAPYGKPFSVPVYVVTDNKGNVYSVSYTVKNGGEDVTVVSGKFDVEKLSDYTITYTVEAGGEKIEKVTVVKPADETKPVISATGMKKQYVTGESIALPEVTVTDDLDTEPIYKLTLKKGDEVKKENVAEAFTVDEAGRYALLIEAKDAAGNSETKTLDFVVRAAAKKGEAEDFGDELALECVSVWNDSNLSPIEKGYGSVAGRAAMWLRTADDKGNTVKYPGLSFAPRISKAEAEALKADGFTAVSVEYYIDYTASRNAYQKWSGKQLSYATKLKEWATLNLPLDTFIENYDEIAAGSKTFLYFGNDPAYVSDGVCADFKVYISSVYITKTVTDITFADDGINHTANAGEALDVTRITAASAEASDATFEYTYYAPDGSEIVPADGKITPEGFGVYKVTAKIADKCYRGEKTYELSVKATKAYVEELIEEILAAEDISAMGEKAEELKHCYETLTEEEKDEIDAFRYVKASTLLREKANGLFYFDTAAGREQVTLEYNKPSADGYIPVTTKNGVTYVTDVKYGNEAGSTKFTFEDAPLEWIMPYTVRLSLPSGTNLSEYGYIRFFMRAYSWNAQRPLCYNVAVNGTRITETAQPVALKNEEWQEVIIPLSYITGAMSTVTINFSSNNNNNVWASVWNNPDKMYVHFSGMYLGKYVNDIEISSQFKKEKAYVTGATVDMSKFVASSASYPDAEYDYTVISPSGATSAMGGSLTLTEEGEYRVIASMRGVYVRGSKEVRLTAITPNKDKELFAFGADTTANVKVTTDWKDLPASAYSLSADDAYGLEKNCLKIVAPANSGYVIGLSLGATKDLSEYSKIYIRVKTTSTTTGYALYKTHANVAANRFVDKRKEYFAKNEWKTIEVSAESIDDFGTLTLVFINNGWGSKYAEGTEFYISSVYGVKK